MLNETETEVPVPSITEIRCGQGVSDLEEIKKAHDKSITEAISVAALVDPYQGDPPDILPALDAVGW